MVIRRVAAIALLAILLVTGAPVAAGAASVPCPVILGMKACIEGP